MALKKLLYSTLLGPSIGLAPYAVATSLPNSGPIIAKGENAGFGKRCLLDQEICDLMAETEFKQDAEGHKKSEGAQNQGKKNKVKEKLEKDWAEFIKKRGDDYCGFGFFSFKVPSQSLVNVKTSELPKVDVNNLENCYQELIKEAKSR